MTWRTACPAESGKVIQSSNFEKAWRGYTARRKRAKGLVKTYYPATKKRRACLTRHHSRLAQFRGYATRRFEHRPAHDQTYPWARGGECDRALY